MISIQKLTEKKLFLLIYFITFLSIALDVAGGFPFASVLRKLKYVYFVVMLVMIVSKKRVALLHGAGVILAIFFIHTCVWGLTFVNPQVAEYTQEHFTQMVWFLLLLTVTAEAVIKYRAYFEFICVSYGVLSFTLLWALSRFQELRHPKFFLSIFGIGSMPRWKATFGFIDANYVGFYCFTALILSFFIYDYFLQGSLKKYKNKIITLLILDFIFFWMLLSSGSRSNVIAFLLFVFLYIYNRPCAISRKYSKTVKALLRLLILIIAVVVIVFGISALGDYIWNNSNRSQNVDVNFPVFKEMNAWLKGMGYVENTGFALDIFGYDTWNIDMYYLYIFFSTGILGSILIGGTLLIILFYILSNYKRQSNGRIILPLYIAILFNAFWQVNICTYRFYPSLMFMVLLLEFVSTASLQKKRYIIR